MSFTNTPHLILPFLEPHSLRCLWKGRSRPEVRAPGSLQGAELVWGQQGASGHKPFKEKWLAKPPACEPRARTASTELRCSACSETHSPHSVQGTYSDAKHCFNIDLTLTAIGRGLTSTEIYGFLVCEEESIFIKLCSSSWVGLPWWSHWGKDYFWLILILPTESSRQQLLNNKLDV